MIHNRLCRRILFLTLLLSLTVLLLLSFISCSNSADTSVPNANETADNGFSIEESESIRVETDRDGSVIRLYVDRENRGIDLEAIASSKQTFTVTDSKGELIPNNVIVAEESGASFTVYYGIDKTPYRLTVYFNEYCNLTFEGVETVIKVLKGETVKSPNIKPTKIGHIFVGWDFDFSEAVTADAHINAKWKPSTYTITFDANGGKLDSSSMIVTFGENVLLPLPVMSGYVFIGWHDGTKVVDSGVWSIDQNVVLKAMWDHHDYKVTYDPNGGTVDKTLQGVSYGDPFVSPIPKREGFTFLGWFCDGVLIDNTSYAYQEDKVFVAEWKLNTYNVTFESNGGSPIESGEYLYSEIKQVIPARDGYTFGGWFFDIGLTLTDTDVSSDNRVTVYAWWMEEDKPSYYHYELHDSGAIILGYVQRSYAAVIPSYIGGKNVVAIGDHAFENCKNITSVVLPKSISRIGEYAFYGCDSLIALNSLGIDGGYTVSSFEGIKEIGKYAFSECAFEKIVSCDSISTLSDGIFENCKDLVSIQLGKPDKIGNSVFCGCEKLESVNLSGNATAIGESVLQGCVGLNSVTLPDKLEKIGNQAFNGCVSLVSMTLPKSVTVIGDGAFQGCFSLSDLANFMSLRGLKSIGAYAFSGCEKLSGIGILPSVNTIGIYAFENCLKLQSVAVPDTLTVIPQGIFSGCRNLSKVTLSSTIIVIESYAFSGCQSLSEFIQSDSLQTIGDYAFEDCVALTTLVLPSNLKEIGKYVFKGCMRLSQVTIPVGITVVSEGFFDGCSALSTVNWHNGITEIQARAFASCQALLIDRLPNSCAIVGEEAFTGCHMIRTLTIDRAITSIASRAFSDCVLLTKITFGGSNERWKGAVDKDAFKGCPDLKVIEALETTEDLLPWILPIPSTNAFWTVDSTLEFNQNRYAAKISFSENNIFYKNLVNNSQDAVTVNSEYVWRVHVNGATDSISSFTTMITVSLFDVTNSDGYDCIVLDLGEGIAALPGIKYLDLNLEIVSASDDSKILYSAALGRVYL